MPYKSIHVVANGIISFIFMVKLYFTVYIYIYNVYIYNILFIIYGAFLKLNLFFIER